MKPGGKIEDAYPLTPLQEGILFESLSAPETAVYVSQAVFLIEDARREALEEAWRRVVERHAVLRSAFAWQKTERPLQVVGREVKLPIHREDWSGLDADEQARRLERFLAEDRQRGFSFAKAPLMRLAILDQGPTTVRLVWTFHHVLLDGWSVVLLLKEVIEAYAACRDGRDLEWPAPRPFRDYVTWLEGQDRRGAEAYWRERLEGFTGPSVLDLGRPLAPSAEGDVYSFRETHLSLPLTEALRARAREARVTLNTVAQVAWSILLSRYTGRQDVVYGTTSAGRPADLEGAEAMVGLFINSLPVRVQVSPGERLRAMLERVQLEQAAQRPFDWSPLVDVQKWGRVPRGVPLFETLMAFESYPVPKVDAAAAGTPWARQTVFVDNSNYPLSLAVRPDRQMYLRLLFDRRRFEAAAVERLLGHFETLLAGIAADLERPVADLPLVTEQEERELVSGWNATGTDYPRESTLEELFREQASGRGGAVAVSYGARSLSYAELDLWSNRLARHLRKAGVGPGVRVGLCLERSTELVAAMLGIVKASGAYVPLDPSYPAERLAFMARDSEIRLTVTREALAATLPDLGVASLCLDRDGDAIALEEEGPFPSGSTADSLVYVIYTSGSTGIPKGVAVPHRAVTRLVRDTDYITLSPEDRVVQAANASFDAITFEVWGPLLNGARIVGVVGDDLLSPPDLARRLRADGATVFFLTTALFNQVVRECPDAFAELRVLLFGGEAVDPARVRTALGEGAPGQLLHVYGPTENTTFSTWHEVREVAADASTVPIGLPLANGRMHVLDGAGRVVPVGVPGELYLGGDGLAHGYLGRPDLTAAAFVPDPFGPEPGARLYRTGDRVRRRADGSVDFLGRIDQQVKLRGFRVEPGEVEATLGGHPGIEAVAVVVRDEPPGGKRLVAYVAGGEGPGTDEESLRQWSEAKLPPYMVPSAFVRLPRLPLTANGKVDRAALPAPTVKSEGHEGPHDPIERDLAEIWARVLGLETVGVAEDFFALGGHSLLATRVVSQIRRTFDVELPLRALFEAPTVQGLAVAVRSARGARGASAPPLVTVSRAGGHPLSFAQQRLWFLDRIGEGSAYHVSFGWRLSGPLDEAALEGSLAAIVRRHEALRTRFAMVDGRPLQEADDSTALALARVDLGTQADPEAEARRRAALESRRPFDLGQAPLLRATLMRLGEDDHALVLVLHHIVADGWSLAVLGRELGALYTAAAEGREPGLEELPVQYADYAAWQRDWLSGEVLEGQLSYWRRALEGLSVLQLPTDRPRTGQTDFSGALEMELLPEETARSLRSLCQREGVTAFMVLLAAFQALLGKWAGQSDVAVGTPIAGRGRSEIEGLIGFFVNNLVMRADLSGDPSFRELLGRVKEASLGAYDHQEVPFEKLVEELAPARDIGQNPLFQVVFAFQSAPTDAIALGEVRLRPLGIEVKTSRFDLELHVQETAGRLATALVYRTDLFDRGTVRRLLGHYRALLEQALAHPEARLGDLSLLEEDETDRVLREWNATAVAFPRDETIAGVFEDVVSRAPSTPAVTSGGVTLSYGALDHRANRLAHHLQRLGVAHGARVGLAVEPGLELAVALLGILKAGGSYVPLDPDYPVERRRFMVRDSGLQVIVTRGSGLDLASETDVRLVDLDGDREEIERESDERLSCRLHAEDLAYVTYTSGSTGTPKGVEIPNRGVLRLLFGVDYATFGPEQVFLQLAPVSFDASTLELWGPLLHGGRCVVYPERVPTARGLQAVIRDEGVTTLWLTSSLFNAVVDESPEAFAGLRQLLVGGEALSVAHVRRALAANGPELRIINGYGPTESTTFTCCHPIPPDLDARTTSIPIGRPIGNTRVYVVDRGMRPVPVGVPGELCIGGDGLARGYQNRPGLTAERFVPDPFSGSAGSRLYRTGDRVRWRADGTLEFLGRDDHQVKVRGFRVASGEIETVLRGHAAVREALAIVREDGPTGRGLVAYVTPGGTGSLDTEALRGWLAERMPAYAVPSAIVALEALPLSSRGKVNRHALPAPERLTDAYQAPRTRAEQTVARIWADALGVERVGVRDNFFDLGGHSLLLVQVHRRLADAFPEQELAVVDLFRHPTVQALAGRLEPKRSATALQVQERAGRQRDPRETGIAVVSMAGRFPGAGSVEEFWDNLRGGVESIAFFDADDLRESGLPGELLDDPRYVAARGVLDGVESFDAGFFGFTPREAEVTDPQHRLFLETAWEALERAGCNPGTYEGLVGVYAGVGVNAYAPRVGADPDTLARVGGLAALIGNDKDFLATRVSYKLNLKGPSVVVQTACSTSLVAVHLACRSLLGHECDLALAGGVSIRLPQKSAYRYSEAGILSPDGHCRAFDARAQGTVGGSGVGVVALKRLEDALRDGDPIEAVIRGSAINNDGSERVGYTAPGVAGQAEVIALAQAVAGVEPDSVGYIEAHGTGTALGDPIEVDALRQVFEAGTSRKGFCALGSLKTNVGHLDAAAGVAGLIKAVLALKHGELPPSLHYETPNPTIDFEGSPFFVNDQLRPWPPGPEPRRAGVSSFGIGGTNAHVVLEEAPSIGPSDESRDGQILVISARTETAADEATRRLGRHLAEHPGQALADVAFTLQVGRRAFRHRRALVSTDAAEAREVLLGDEEGRLLRGEAGEPPGEVVFLFPGQGAQYVGMGEGLFHRERVFREEIDRCAEYLRGELGLDLREILYPTDGKRAEASRRLAETSLTQPALFAVEWALARLWMDWGVAPVAMLGHSVGEYVAACVAGVMTLESALLVVAARGRLMGERPRGAMSAVALSEDELTPLLGDGLSLAAVNAPRQCVVSGTEDALGELEARLAGLGVEPRRLRTSHAFHSGMMEPVLEPFADVVRGIRLEKPRIPFVSNLTGAWARPEEVTTPEYWVSHLRETVRFADGVQTLLEEEDRFVVEVGPGRTLSGLVRAVASSPPRVLSSMRHPDETRSDEQTLLETLGRLWAAGREVDWHAVHRGQRRRRVALPTYPFERRRYWIEASPVTSVSRAGAPAKRPDVADWFYLPTWVRSVAPPVPPAPPRARWVVLADDAGLGEGVIHRLEGQGHEVISVVAGHGELERDGRRYRLDPRRHDDYDALVEDLLLRDELPERVIHLWGLAPEGPGPDRSQDLGFYSLLHLAQALRARTPETAVKVSVFTTGVQDVTGAEPLRPPNATVLGPCRVVPQEHPAVRCRSIDLELPSSGDLRDRVIEQIVHESVGDSPDLTVAYRGGRRWVQRYEPLALAPRPGGPARLREGGVYLITGGLGGIGLELAHDLARVARARLVLVTRPAPEPTTGLAPRSDQSALEARRKRKLEEIRAAGGQVLVLHADVADAVQMKEAVSRARGEFGALHGVIHAAGGDNRPRPFPEESRAHCEELFRPKLQGLQALEEALRDVPLDFCLVHSSLSSVLGAVGFVAYTAAHVFMDVFAAQQGRAQGVPWIAVNWDNWTTWKLEGRTLPAGAADVLMTTAEGLEAFHRVLDVEDTSTVVVSAGDLAARIDRWLALSFLEERAEPSPGSEGRHPRPALQTAYAAPRDGIESALAEIWQDLLGIDRVGRHDNFFELGGDSVVGIQLVARAGAAGLRLNARQVFAHPTLAELASVAGAVVPAAAEEPEPEGAVPLVPIQRWFFEQDLADPHHFNQSFLFEVRRPLEPVVLEAAVAAVAARHDAFRLRYVPDADGEVEARKVDDAGVEVEQVDLSDLAETEQSAALEAAARRFQSTLDLVHGPLMRVVRVHRGAGHTDRLLLIAHHVAVDALSWRVLMEDLEAACRQIAAGQECELPSATTSFARWAHELAGFARSDSVATETDHWLALPWDRVASLPIDQPGGENTAGSTATVSGALDPEDTAALLQGLPDRLKAGANEALLTALVRALASWTGRDTLLLDLEGHGREPVVDRVDLSRTVGWFTSLYPVLLESRDDDLAVSLRSVKEQVRAIPGRGFGYGLLRYLHGDAALARKLEELPQAEISFVYLGRFEPVEAEGWFAAAGEAVGPQRSPRGRRRHLLEVVSGVRGGRLWVSWIYSENLHRRSTVEGLNQAFLDAVRDLVRLSPEAQVHTASDFPGARLEQRQLEEFLSGIDQGGKRESP